MVRLVSLAVLTAAIAVLGVMFFRVIAPFLLPLFLAAVAAVLCQPALRKAHARTGGREGLAAGLVTAAVLAGILVPVGVAVIFASAQAYSFSQQVSVESLRKARDGALDFGADQLVAWQEYLPTGVRPPQVPRARRDLLLSAAEVGLFEEIELPDDGEVADAEGGSAGDPADDSATSDEALRREAERVARRLAYLEGLPLAVDEKPRNADDRAVVAELSPGTRERLVRLRDRYRTSLELQGDAVAQRKFFRDELLMFVNDARDNFDETMMGVAGKTVGGTLGLVGQTLGVALGALVTLGIFTFALYYFLADGPKLIAAAENLIPVHANYQHELLTQFATVVRAVVLATFLAALVQGVLATLALWACGFDHLLLLLVGSVVASLIPVAGTTLVWAPCAVILAAQGHYLSAALLTVWGAAVIGTMDNVVRTYILNNDTKLHPLLALISVLGGIQVMGFWGVFVGPIVASCLHALVKIFNQELSELSKERFGAVEQEPRAIASGAPAATGTVETPRSEPVSPASPPNREPDVPVTPSDSEPQVSATDTAARSPTIVEP